MADNRERLEQAALAAVQRGGIKGLSFRTLADDVGIKSSSVHYHFPEKSDLARALIERYSREFFSLLAEIESKRWGLPRKLKAFVGIFEDVAGNDKLCLCGMMAAEFEQLDKANRELLGLYFENTEKWLADLLEAHEAELEPTISPQMLAKSLLSGLEGALLVDRVIGNNQRIRAQKETLLAFLK